VNSVRTLPLRFFVLTHNAPSPSRRSTRTVSFKGRYAYTKTERPQPYRRGVQEVLEDTMSNYLTIKTGTGISNTSRCSPDALHAWLATPASHWV